MKFIEYILDTSSFVPRLHCGPGWSQALMYLSIIPNTLVVFCFLFFAAEAYVLFVYRNPNVENKRTFRTFAVVFFLCGVSRTSDTLAFKWPAYRFFVLLDWICAISFFILCFKHSDLFNYLSNFKLFKEKLSFTERLHIENEKYMKIKEELEDTNRNLKMTIDRLQYMVESQVWLVDKNSAVAELESLLKDINK